ncbi:MAG: SLC13 family permease [Candidatus Hydrogenedentes bacterium]|nr:SLC13 family permease [Candidatus Hydrogenedentota bacterium]
MSWEAIYCLCIMAGVLAGLAANFAPDALLVGALVLVALAGVVSPEEAFVGFSNTGMLTVGALFVVAGALRETGALDTIGSWVLGRAKSERSVLLRLAGSVTAMSAFLNNTPIVAMFIPIITDWCKKNGVAASRLLLPLSYLCILGGTCTLIGTSTNLVVNGLMGEAVRTDPALAEGLHPMGLFELGYVGLPYAVVGTLYLVLVGRHLLPRRKDLLDQLADTSREYLVNLLVQPNCRLLGNRIEEAGLRRLPGLFLIEIVREGHVISPVPPDQILRAGDVLTFTGVVGTIVDLKRIPGLVPVGDEGYETRATHRRNRVLCEAVVSGTSPCLGKTIRDADFRAAYNAAVVAVHRGGERLQGKIGDVVLRPGDTLLLQTGPHFVRANRNNPDFLLASGVEEYRPVRYEKAVIALVLLGALIAMMASGKVKIVTAAFLVAALMVVSRCISVSDARKTIDWQTLITIAAAFGLGKALVNSGCVEVIARFVVAVTGQWGAVAVLAGVYAMTSLFTEIITNNAAAALVFPFAVAIAGQLGVSPRPFVMVVAFAASASFMTPLGYQTNLMVYGPGGYRFTDFLRVGLPLNLLLLTCAVLLVPLVWPF